MFRACTVATIMAAAWWSSQLGPNGFVDLVKKINVK
jgi:hypothetical protein